MDLGRVLVTGAAGFIGFHVASQLLARGAEVVGLDNLNDYYDPTLKQARLQRLCDQERFRFERLDLVEAERLRALFASMRPARVIHLAAQAGVRYSLTNPDAYIAANVQGFLNILEACRHTPVQHLVYASTSSVYGANTRQPFSEHEGANHPLSLYAATKKANEMMAHTYAHLFAVPCTGLRFFTVYGPWGRPDMALFKFTKAILAGQPIELYNHGDMVRDFTYVDDVVESIIRISGIPPSGDRHWSSDDPDPATSHAPFRIYNIGNNQPIQLTRYVAAIERSLGRKAKIQHLPMQPGDVPSTMADVSDLEQATGFRPRTTVEEGIQRFVDWYREYHGV